jgi:hypothetical protein
MHDRTHLPYSRRGLENLAAALGVDSAYLWVNPQTQRLDIKAIGCTSAQTTSVPEPMDDLEEDE